MFAGPVWYPQLGKGDNCGEQETQGHGQWLLTRSIVKHADGPCSIPVFGT